MKRIILLLGAFCTLHCNGNTADDATPIATSTTQASTAANRLEVEDLEAPPENISLLVLDGKTDTDRLARELERRIHGLVYHELPPRLMVVSVPPGVDAVLTQLGVTTRYARALDPSEVANATIEEQRFIRVFSNRYYPAAVTPKLALAPTHRVLAPGEPFEASARVAPPSTSANALAKAALVPSGTLTTPFASGTIVVSLILPESNGVAEPSTEDWTEDAIADTYLKVQTALEAIKRAEPNNDLRFIIHYESAPAPGGLPGTVDSDYEYGQHADFTNLQDELNVSAPLLAKLLGHPVTPDQVFEASWEYNDLLRARYHADGAFYIKVGCNTNFTASFRAHAFINGPWNTLPSDQTWNTFMHETGHVFGALDEYCPDACVPTTALQGYLGMPNANAAYLVGGDGINNGQGELEPSLMSGNDWNSVNGYTRGAWGWLDTDGDGIVEVRDTTPETRLFATVTGADVHLEGTVYDVPAKRLFAQPGISFNRIEAVEYQIVPATATLASADATDAAAAAKNAPWFELPVHQTTFDGPIAVELDLGAFPAGDHAVRVRSRNSVGNTDAPQTIEFVVGGPVGNTPPRVHLVAAPNTGSVRSTFTLTANTFDLDANDHVQVRFDTNGDGVFDTAFGTSTTITLRPHQAGVYTVVAQARDRRGATSTDSVRLFVLDGNTSPVIDISPTPSLVFGAPSFAPTLSVVNAHDADGDALAYNWIAELATADGTFRNETGFAAGNTQFVPTLPTPKTLLTTPIDLAAGDKSLASHTWAQSLALTPNVVATAAGINGLVVTDVTDPNAPTLLAHLSLQTDARQLWLDGTRLYVLGTLLTVVDVTHPRQPVEIPQQKALKHTYVDVQAPRGGSIDIPDGPDGRGVGLDHLLAQGERIDSIQIQVEVNHPSPADLRFDLDFFNGSDDVVYTLRDRVKGPGGDHVYNFTNANTPALAPLLGQMASGQFEMRVTDTAAGNVGTLVKSTLTVKTVSHAFAILAGAKPVLAGTLPNHDVVVAALGVQTIDATTPSNLKQASLLAGTPTYSAQLSGTNVLVISPLTIPPPKDGSKAAPTPTPAAHGLYAVDLSNAAKPKLVRVDETFGEDAGELAIFGTRFYVNPGTRDGGNTQVDSVAAFLAGNAYQLGTLPTRVGDRTTTFGDDHTLWSVAAGHVQELDVSSPANAQLLADYPRPNLATMTRLSNLNVLLWDGTQSFEANLNFTANDTSRTYRITLQARDAFGGLAAETRTIHVIPYDHAPSVTAAVTSGARAGDTFTFTATPVDPDTGMTWDPDLFTRADLDGDGIYETDWQQSSGGRDGTAVTFQATFATAGTYTVHFQTRDTFWALTTATLTFTVAP